MLNCSSMKMLAAPKGTYLYRSTSQLISGPRDIPSTKFEEFFGVVVAPCSFHARHLPLSAQSLACCIDRLNPQTHCHLAGNHGIWLAVSRQ